MKFFFWEIRENILYRGSQWSLVDLFPGIEMLHQRFSKCAFVKAVMTTDSNTKL